MPKRAKVEDCWRALKEQTVNEFFKLGSIFFWNEEKHFFIYLGSSDESIVNSFLVMASSQPHRNINRNFTIVPEDFRTAKQETKSQAFRKNTHFLLRGIVHFSG
jgi:hypothetical protein